MDLLSQEHYALMDLFEKTYNHKRLDREKDKSLWEKGFLYANGETNALFLAFRLGYSLGIAESSGEVGAA